MLPGGAGQMGAWASNQSRPIGSREELDKQLEGVKVRVCGSIEGEYEPDGSDAVWWPSLLSPCRRSGSRTSQSRCLGRLTGVAGGWCRTGSSSGRGGRAGCMTGWCTSSRARRAAGPSRGCSHSRLQDTAFSGTSGEICKECMSRLS